MTRGRILQPDWTNLGAMARTTGWVPNQHGAWAMLVVPFAAGVILRARDAVLAVHLIPLFAFWMLGYFAFHAASQWLKAPPKRRPAFARPAVVYAAASAGLGVATLWLGGWGMAAWVVWYLPLLLPALWLAAQRHERATIGGALTTAAASLMLLVARYDTPAALAADPGERTPLLTAALVFAYFFGTVLYVKTNIRERGNPTFLAASIAWHVVLACACLALAALVGWPWWWVAFFAATAVRAVLVPRRRPAPTARQIGLLEVALSTLLVIGIAVA